SWQAARCSCSCSGLGSSGHCVRARQRKHGERVQMKMTLAAIGLLAGAACPALGATLVACPAGTAAKGCTYKGDGAIQHAIDRAADGDIVLVRAGVYTPRAYRDLPYKEIIVRAFVAVDGKHLTIQGEKGAVLDGSAGLPTTAIGL